MVVVVAAVWVGRAGVGVLGGVECFSAALTPSFYRSTWKLSFCYVGLCCVIRTGRLIFSRFCRHALALGSQVESLYWVTKSSKTEAGGGFGSAQRHRWLSGLVCHLAWHWGSLRVASGLSKEVERLKTGKKLRKIQRHFPNLSQDFPLAKNVQGYSVKRSRKRPVSHLQSEKYARAVAMVPEDCSPFRPLPPLPVQYQVPAKEKKPNLRNWAADRQDRQDFLEASESVCNCLLYVWEESLRPSWALWCQLIGRAQPNALKLHRILPAENGIRPRASMGWNLRSMLLQSYSFM